MDGLKAGVSDLPYCAGALAHIEIGGLHESHVDELRRHARKLQHQMECDDRPIPEHGWACFHCAETFTTVESASAHFGDDPANGRPHCVKSLAALQAQVGALKEALRPFAEVAEHDIGQTEDDTDQFQPMARFNKAPSLTVGDLRRARALLEQEPSS